MGGRVRGLQSSCRAESMVVIEASLAVDGDGPLWRCFDSL